MLRQTPRGVRFPSAGYKKDYVTVIFMVPRGGIEPPLPKEADFESAASTNSATWATVSKE